MKRWKKDKQMRLNFDYGISAEQACVLCHLSAECHGCCVKCQAQGKNNGCQGQMCSRPYKDFEGKRWDTWMHIASDKPELLEYIPPKFRNALKKRPSP